MSRRTARAVTLAISVTAGFVASAPGQTFNISWDGASTGLFSTGVNWSTNVVPLNNAGLGDFFNVTINRVGGATVTGDVGAGSILNLTIGSNAGNQLLLVDTAALSIIGASGGGAATVNNQGTLTLGSTLASAAQLLLAGTTTNLAGGGTINLLGNSLIGGAGTVTSNNTLIGVGNIGNNSIALINNGTISASGGTLTVDGRSLGGVDNNGLMEALPGGTLALSGNGGGIINNAGGTIASNGISGNNGRVQLLDSISILGGTLSTSGFGQFFMPANNGTVTLNGVTNNADINIQPTNNVLNLFGGITNNNRIRTNNAAGVATYNIGGSTVTLSGTGSLVLSQFVGAQGNVIGTGTLINGAGHTIAGAGTIGDGSTTIRNSGLINANLAGQTLVLRPELSSAGAINNGIIRAGAGTIQLGQGDYGNLGGIFDVLAGAALANASGGGTVNILDGVINIANGGTLLAVDPTAPFSLGGVVVNNAGLVQVASGGSISAAATTINNTGSILIGGTAGTNRYFVRSGTHTFAGGGQVVLSNAAGGTAVLSGTATLLNLDNTIRGAGTIGEGSLTIINAGTIVSDVGGGTLAVNPGATAMLNTGTLTSTVGNLSLVGGTISNAGGTILANGANVLLQSNVFIQGGMISSQPGPNVFVSGTNTATLADVTNLGAIGVSSAVVGTLNLVGTITNNGSITAAGIAVINASAGTTTLAGTGSVRLGGSLIGLGTLVNSAGHTIEGDGTLGNNAIAIRNAGLISANDSGQTLTVDPAPAGALTNTGTLQATNFGTLLLTGNGGGNFVSSTGTVSAAGGTVHLTGGALISTGTIRSDAGSRVVINGGSGGFAGVTNTAQVDVTNGTLTLNSIITNNGTINVVTDVNAATVALTGIGATLSGTGQMLLAVNGTGTATLTGATFTNGATHTIRGRGNIGNNTSTINNAGTISASIVGQSLTVDPGVLGWTNSGTMNATGSGVLLLQGNIAGPTLNNAGGQIIANVGSNVRLLDGLTVSGGTLATVGTGSISVPAGNTATLLSVTSTGNLRVNGQGTLVLNGVVNNAGSITVDGTGTHSRLTVGSAGATAAGAGTINLIGPSAAISLGGTFENQSNTISGRGGISGSIFVNSGTVEANLPGQVLSLTPGSLSQYQNHGVLRAVNGGILEFLGGFFVGPIVNIGAGTIHAADGSMVRINQMGVIGGTLSTAGTGTINIQPLASIFDATINGHVVMNSGNDLNIGSLVTSNGPFDVTAGGDIELSNQSPTTFRNTSTLTMTPGVLPPRITGVGTFINDGTATGGWRIDPASGGSINVVNSGLIEGVGTSGFQFTDGTVNVSNSGTLRAAAGSSFQVSTETIVTGAGTIDVRPGGSFATGGDVSAGTSTIDGSLFNVGTASLGRLSGSGTLQTGFIFMGTALGNTTVTHSRVPVVNLVAGSMTTSAGGGTIGTSRVTTLVLNTGTKWDLTNHDLIVDYDLASPLPTVLALIQSGFSGGAWTGNGLTSSTAAAAAPTPDKTGLGYAEAGELFGGFPVQFSGQTIDSTTVLVKYTLFGDANLSGNVDIGDFAILAANFNTSGRWNRGDFNYDQQIDIGDFALLASNFNKALPVDLPRGGAVPEPMALAAAALTAAAATLRRRRSM